MTPNPPPRYGTPRRPDRPTTGTRSRRIAGQLGVQLHPWQAHVLDVAGELDPSTGLHAYSTITVSVGRRGGKSLLVLVRQLATAFAGRRQRGWYTAQTRSDAALILRDEWAPVVDASPLAPLVHVRRSNGSESLLVPRLGSAVRVFAPTRTALHGQDGDVIVFDEAWTHSRDAGAELYAAARPLTMTRPGAQTWIVSAAGDVDSTWWLDELDAGRAAVAADRGRGRAHFEWSADAPGLDLDDPATWLDSHPATYPGGTVSIEWLHDEHERDPAMFARTVLNVTDRTGVSSAPIDVDTWSSLAVEAPERVGALVFGVDVAADQSATSIVACLCDGTTTTVELVDRRPGHTWAAARLVELLDRYDDALHVAYDAAGQSPASVLTRPLELAGVPTLRYGLADVTAASADFVAAVRSGTVRHVPHPALDAAVSSARRRLIGDGSWTWQRVGADADQSPLIAATFARWAHPDVLGASSPSIT